MIGGRRTGRRVAAAVRDEGRLRRRLLNARSIPSLLTQLEDAQLVRRLDEAEALYSFKHVLTQETAYESLVTKRRRVIHRAVAQAYEELYPDRLDENAALLAEHYDQAGDDTKTLEYATRAGDAAARVYANAEAVEHYTHALRAAAQVPAAAAPNHRNTPLTHLYLSRGRALELSNRYDEAVANYIEMEVLAHASGDLALRLAALMARATIHSTGNPVYDPNEGQALSHQALLLAREIGDREAESKTLWILMLFEIFGRGDFEQAAEYGEQSLSIAREMNLREQMGFALTDLSKAYAFAGQIERARVASEEAAQLWQALGNVPMLAETLTGSANYYSMRGNYDRALALWEESYRLCESIGNVMGQANSLVAAGVVHFDSGRTDQAIETMKTMLRLGEQAGHPATASVRSALGWTYASLGATAEGLETVQNLLDEAREPAPPWMRGVHAVVARIHLLHGEIAKAHAVLREAYGGFEHNFMLFNVSTNLALAYGEMALAAGDRQLAISIADEMVGTLRQLGVRPSVSDGLDLKAKALLAGERTDEAYAVLLEARIEAEAIGSRRTLWPVLLKLSEIEAARGNRADAVELRTQAQQIVEYIADHIGRLDLRASLLNLPDVQAVLEGKRPWS